jgi:TonB family protein
VIIAIITIPVFAVEFILGGGRAASSAAQNQDSTENEIDRTLYLDSAEVAALQGLRGQTMTGQRSRASVMRGIDRNSNTIRREYRNYINQGNRLGGGMIVRFKIVSSGDVIECRIVESNIGDPIFETNVVLAIKNWKFPPIEIENDTTIVEYPFVFEQY